MPIDISTYLNKVKTEPGFNAVRGAVANASETIATALFAEEDIEEELNVIRTGVYGRDIREAIYSALNKLSQTDVPIQGVTDDFTPYYIYVLSGDITSDFEEVD